MFDDIYIHTFFPGKSAGDFLGMVSKAVTFKRSVPRGLQQGDRVGSGVINHMGIELGRDLHIRRVAVAIELQHISKYTPRRFVCLKMICALNFSFLHTQNMSEVETL